ncbi:MAG TPA: tannase/feruloyl esterase family alpha/beta hydrolase [Anaeromyxobacter sp.]|nr:tannase/feruloyl esterase family alpha/beta hydrolase [Anaeromyxobacter sp.]
MPMPATPREELVHRGRYVAVAALLALAVPASARAAVACDAAALGALRVPGVTVLQATPVAALGGNPAFCSVVAAVATSGMGAPDGSATVLLDLPSGWNGKFLFFGTGGLAGVLSPSANAPDVVTALARGYATANTDTGHQGNGLTPADGLGKVTDGRWALRDDGSPDEAKLADYFFRATHQATIAGKAFTSAFYGAPVRRAYFDGCSNGGRQALVEASRFPEDYDGIIAGAPFFDIRIVMGGANFEKTLLRSPATYVPFQLLPGVDRAIVASCDAADGVADGLIQNPGACAFDPASLVCAGGNGAGCLTALQAETLRAYFTALRDDDGKILYTGAAVGDLDAFGGLDLWGVGFVPPADFAASEPWGNLGFTPAPITWQFVDHIMKFIVARDPAFAVRDFPADAGVVSDAGVALFDARTAAGSARDPEAYRRFLREGRKLLLYHGYSDPALPAFRTVRLYEALARTQGGRHRLADGARLFMVPGMQHCGGGSGPNVFDTLSALEAWVEQGKAPDAIVAAHFQGNDPTKGIDRSMPLCPFPTQATYDGKGDPTKAASWSCRPNGKLLRVGPNGVQAGLVGPLAGDDGE